MGNILDDFNDELVQDNLLVVMPISRFVIEDNIHIGKYRFYSIGEVDIRALRPVRNNSLSVPSEYLDQDFIAFEFEGQKLREAATAITSAGPDIFDNNTLVAFTVSNIHWDEFLTADHEYDRKTIRNLTREVEKVMDLVRFHFCRADLVETLPGTVGTWDDSGGFSTVLIYNYEDHESYIIAGSVITHAIVKGIGLQLDLSQVELVRPGCEILLNSNGEVGSIVKAALSMHTSFLETNSRTTQFVKAMTLLEFLAFPDRYKPFEDVRKQITLHIARDYNHYLELKDRFIELTGKQDEVTKKHIGYRTRIVHIGDDLEDILDNDERKINGVMLEVQRYIGTVILDMIQNHNMTWSEFEEVRRLKRIRLGLD